MLMDTKGIVIALAVYAVLLLVVLVWQRVQINREEERHEAEMRRWAEERERYEDRLADKRKVLDRLGVKF